MSFFKKTEPLLTTCPFDIDQRISEKAKRLALRVNYTSGRIELVIPRRMPNKLVERFLYQNQDWIEDKQKTIPTTVPFSCGTKIPLFGSDTLIRSNVDTSLKRTKVSLNDDVLLITTYLEDPSQRIQRFLKKESLARFEVLAHEKAAHIDRGIQSISIRDTKSRWGSCSHDGRLSLSWRLIFAPVSAMDYVIAHEVSHLKHMDHSPSFWKTCEKLSLDYEKGKFWMKEHGYTLMRYGR